jgi:hypothetical protein
LDELLCDVAARDLQKTALEFSGLAIPSQQEWFLKIFGSTEGPRLESRYVEFAIKDHGWLKNRFEFAIKRVRPQ